MALSFQGKKISGRQDARPGAVAAIPRAHANFRSREFGPLEVLVKDMCILYHIYFMFMYVIYYIV